MSNISRNGILGPPWSSSGDVALKPVIRYNATQFTDANIIQIGILVSGCILGRTGTGTGRRLGFKLLLLLPDALLQYLFHAINITAVATGRGKGSRSVGRGCYCGRNDSSKASATAKFSLSLARTIRATAVLKPIVIGVIVTASTSTPASGGTRGAVFRWCSTQLSGFGGTVRACLRKVLFLLLNALRNIFIFIFCGFKFE